MDKQDHEPIEDYGKWDNYETYAAYTWINNNSEINEALMDIAENMDIEDLADYIESWIEETVPLLVKGLYRDLLDRALRKINWMQIAKIYRDS